jgi:rod shape-determining protein MreB
VLSSVPRGISERALADYMALTEECGLKKVWFVEQPYLTALGAGAIVSDTDPVFCLDIGGGVSNAAVISADGIISGISMNIGGNNIDANIISRIASNSELLVGALTAEKIKNEICSLSSSALGTVVAEGSSTKTCQPAAVPVQAADLTDCVRVYVNKVVEYAVEVLRTLPAEVAATVNRNGVLLSGGIMKIPYVPQYIGTMLGMRYRLSEEPQFSTVLGGGVLLRDKILLNRFAKNSEA